VEIGERDVAFEQIKAARKALYEHTTIVRGNLDVRYADVADYIHIYGICGRVPLVHSDLIKFGGEIIKGHEKSVAEGDPLVLPEPVIEQLRTFIANLDVMLDNSTEELCEALACTAIVEDLFDADSHELGELLNWIYMFWGKYDPRLYELGFVPASEQSGSGGGGGEVPAAPTGFMFEWLEPVLQFSWDAVEGATSYQIAFSEDGGEVWEELYTGEEVGYEYEPPEGMQYYRVRARNADGYGEWSDVVEFEIEGEPPMGEWPNELTGLYANYSDFPSPIIIVGHDGQTGADTYRLKRIKVSIADPDPTNADMPEENYVEGLNEDPFADSDIDPDDKCAYWACGVDAADVEGEWTGPVVGEYPA